MMCRPQTAQEKVKAEWNSMAGEWDDMAAGYRDQFEKMLWEETGYTDANSRMTLLVLDFGCATGLLADALRNQVARVVGIDVADAMIEVFQDKIQAGDWSNVEAYCGVLAHLEQAPPEFKEAMDKLKDQVDIITASSVLSFVPEEDLESTMKVLGGLLKPGTGILCHSDWPQNEEHPDGLTEKKAETIYKLAGLTMKATKECTMKMGTQPSSCFVGTAIKPA